MAGATLLGPGTGITAAVVALVAGAGVADIMVHRRPRIAVLATGDEVRAPGTDLGPAGIPDANGPGLRALVTASGGEPIDLGIATDDLDDVLARLRRGLDAGADALIVSGGVSVGPYDVVKAAIERIGRIDLWRVAVQPGKPFAFGVADRPGGGAPVLLFGLPGNPVSSAVTFELFVRPAIRGLAGRHDLLRPVDRAVLGEPSARATVGGRSCGSRQSATRRGAGPRRSGRVIVHLAGGQDSHVISASPPPTPWPSCRRPTIAARRLARRPVVARPRLADRGAARRRTLVLHPA
jgi:molybdenum cofactor synthesis domain-containing protein